jgi:hypothetical protein
MHSKQIGDAILGMVVMMLLMMGAFVWSGGMMHATGQGDATSSFENTPRLERTAHEQDLACGHGRADCGFEHERHAPAAEGLD